MTDDWLLVALGEVERTAEAAREALAGAGPILEAVRADRLAGVPLVALAEMLAREGLGQRRLAASAFQTYEQAVAALRAQVVHALINEEGATLSGLAGRMGVSRQAVARLYHAGERYRSAP